MRRRFFIPPLVLALAAGVSGCEKQTGEVTRDMPVYQGIDTRLLDGDLVNFHVAMVGDDLADDVDQYAQCAAAQYALIRGYGFARHVRTNVVEQGGVWRGDAVYTISPALPRGLKTIDAEVVAAHCAENGIPMV
ncbi:hypothetical protein AAFO92_04160 [Roseovarius sp. CAU 1744]|uniref:hypothetical protein n=1 Tax=Roseovarius sp. CAU 1744 TaxID=3140368 RepID=UPI00325BACB7